MIYHRTSTRMAIIKGTDKYWQRCGETNPYILLVFLKKLNLPYNPAVPFPGIYSREMKMHIHTKTVAWTFIAALSKIAPPPKWPWTGSSAGWASIRTKKFQVDLQSGHIPMLPFNPLSRLHMGGNWPIGVCFSLGCFSLSFAPFLSL